MQWLDGWVGSVTRMQNVVDAVLFSVMVGVFLGVFVRLIEEALNDK